MSQGVRERLAAIAKPVESAPVVVKERKQYYSRNYGCNIWADTREPVEDQIVDGKRWGGKELGWVPVEPRATRFDRDLCCEVFADTGERVIPQIFVDGLGWVTPPSAEVIDHQAELAAAGWKFAKGQVKGTEKALMRKDIKDIGQRGNLNVSRPFSIMR